MSKIRVHALALPHTITRKDFTICAFTQKVLSFCEMFHKLGIHVIHYGHQDSEVMCDEHVTVITRDLYNSCIDETILKTKGYEGMESKCDPLNAAFIVNCIQEIGKRKQPGDIILEFWGGWQKQISDAHPDLFDCEVSIGYPHAHAKYRVYESYAMMHMHSTAAASGDASNENNNPYHVVIPSGFKLENFEFKREKQDYFIMCGRLGWGKGVHIAARVCDIVGAKLILMGTTHGPQTCKFGDTWPHNVEYIGYADIETRKHYMSNAKALFCPTLYTEPFGYVAIEAQLSGTPVITVDRGGFTETVLHGITGYRCRTLDEFIWATKNIDKINPEDCRYWAEKNYSQERVGRMYLEYFKSLKNIHESTGWYTVDPNRLDLETVQKYYP